MKEYRSNDNTYWHCKRCNDDIHLPFNHIINQNEYMLELYRVSEDQPIIRDRFKPTFYDVKCDPLDKKMYLSQTGNVIVIQIMYICGDDLKDMSKISSKNFNLLNVNIRSL